MGWFEKKATEKDVRKSFKKRDVKIEDLKKEIVSEKQIKLLIENSILKSQTEPKPAPILNRTKSSQKHFEKVILKNALKNRPELIKAAIHGLIEKDMRTTDMLNIIVNEKKICGRTQFHHYLKLVRTELRAGTRTEPNQIKIMEVEK